MLDKLFERIDKKRESRINVTEYGVYSDRLREAVYSDNKEEYVPTEYKTRSLNVSTVDSFVDFIREELKRRGNETGNMSTTHKAVFSLRMMISNLQIVITREV